MPLYEVEVEYSHTDVLQIPAASEEEAQEKAEKIINSNEYDYPDFVDVLDVKEIESD